MAQITLNSSGVASNGSLLLQSNGTTTAVTIDTAQNMGLGVTPSAWGAGPSLQIGGIGVGSRTSLTSLAQFSANQYWDGAAHRYIATNFATLYTQNEGAHTWSIAASGTAGNTISFTTAMTLDASGNLGLGTSSPSSAGASYTGLDIRGSGGGSIRYGVASGFNMLTYALASTVDFLTSAAGDIRFFNKTSSGESLRITSGGALLVGATSGSSRFKVVADGTNVNSEFYQPSTSSYTSIIFTNPNGTVGSITTNGSNTSYATSSDYRLKNSIAPMTGALTKIALLKPVTYKWNADNSDGQGFIAHELQAVIPDCVSGEKDGEEMQGVDYGKITPLLTAALQEAIAKIETLEVRISALEAK